MAIGVVCALLVPAAAWAHATLRAETPGFQQELAASPRDIRLHFDQFVKFPYVQVYDAAGHTFARAATAHGLTIVAPVRKLPKGGYTVRWHALSADGHVVSGVWTFGVRMRAPAPTDAYGADGPNDTEHVVRWLYFLSFAVLIGSLGFRLFVLGGREVPAAVERRIYALAGIGAVAVIQVGILAFCLRCEDVLQLPLGKYIYGDLTPIAQGTRFGKAFVLMTLGFAFVSALVYLAWLLERAVILVPALLLSLGLLSGLSLSGHDALDPGSWVATEIADWVHISAASLWLGGLLSLAVCWSAAPDLRRAAFIRFSRLATVLIALVLAAGTYLAIVRVPHLRDLWTQRYGIVLLVKICLVAAAVAWGGVHHFLIRPRVATADSRSLGRIGRSLAGESMIGVAVLLAAAVLVDSKPPPKPAPGSVSQAVAHRSGARAAALRAPAPSARPRDGSRRTRAR
ncbi:MAG TPA: CopD family protein [Gaiellaceae bacterium]|nr:CopD family protein [Gaiellaceae bacterium]